MDGMKDTLRSRLLWNAGWLRAALEAAAAFLLFFFLLLLLQPSDSVWLIGLLSIALGCASWCALRIQPPSGVWWRCILEEAGMVFGVGVILTAALCIPVYTLELIGAVKLTGLQSIDLVLSAFTFISDFLYAMMRIGIGIHVLAGKIAKNQPRISFFRKVTPARAWLEAALACLAFFFLLIPVHALDYRTGETWLVFLLLECVACAVWLALRARLPSGAGWRIVLHEFGLLAAVITVYFTGVCLPILLLGWPEAIPGMWSLFPPNVFFFYIAFFIYVAFVISRVWMWLSRLTESIAGRETSGFLPAGQPREQPRFLFFFRTGFWRAALEGMAGTFLLSWAVLFDPLRFGNVFLVIIPGIFVAWCALRLRLTSGSWPKRLQREIGFALAYGALLPVALCAAVICLSIPLSGQSWEFLPSIFLLSAPILALVFGVFRAAITLILVWRRFQRRSMVLSLTNAILSIIFAGIAFIIALWSLALIITTDLPVEPSLQSNIISQAFHRLSFVLTPALGILVLLILASLLFILPPAMLFSYLVARSNTQRIRELADAAGAMRGGNYSVQVAVKGEDEVARLQSDFNAMTSDLGRTVREVQTERDRVAGLLQSRRELIAGVSHELRTPVATIRAHLESARRKRSITSLAGELTILDREVIRLQSLIEDLFALSQAEVNKLTLDLKPVDAGEIVRERVAAMAPLAWQPGRVQVTAEVAAGVPQALADRMRLEQSLTNLIYNAVRYTRPGGVVVVTASSETDGIRIDVRDSGEGIAPKDLPNIFDRFYQGKSAAKGSGSGLGLALVKEFAEAMGGSVAVESEVGKGSCFTLRLKQTGK